MAFDELILAFAALLFLVPFAFYVGIKVRNWIHREDVWVLMHTSRNRSKLFLAKPIERFGKTVIEAMKGEYELTSTSPTSYQAGWILKDIPRPLYQFEQGDRRPLKIAHKHVVSANPGDVKDVSFLGHEMIPAESMKVYMDQHDFADAYSNRMGILIILLLGMLFLGLLIVGLYVRR